MSLTIGDREKLVGLLRDLRNGRSLGDECAWLRRRVLEDVEARQLYVDSLWLTGAMSWLFKGSPLGALVSESLPPIVAAHRTGVLGFLSRGTMAINRPVYWSVLAAGVLFAFYIVGISWNMLGKDRGDRLTTSSRDHREAVAVVTASEDARWCENFRLTAASTRQTDTITPGQPLAIDSGIVELELKQGATLVVEGPAEWSIDGENAARLSRGKLVANVPKQAVGFMLETPTARIVDLGTEFGAAVSATGETTLHVLKGEVELAQNTTGDKLERVSAGEAQILRVGSKEGTSLVERIPFDASQVAVKMPSQSPLERWREASEKLRTDPSLVAYYDFENEGSILKNMLADKLHGEIATKRESVPWTDGRFFRKRALATGQNFATVSIADDPALLPSGDWSVAAWLRVDALPPRGSYAQVVGKGSYPKRNYTLWLHSAGGVQMCANGTDGRHYVCWSKKPIAAGRWYFVVGTIDAGRLRLYVDGAEACPAVPIRGSIVTSEEPLVIGQSREPKEPHPFTGAIDELAIFNRALIAQEIQEMYRAGKSLQ